MGILPVVRHAVNDFHLETQTAGLITLGGANDLGNGEYMMLAHEGSAVSAWSTTGAPPVGIDRLARTWRIQETGDLGAVVITLDASSLPSPSSGFINYGLIFDTDADLSDGVVIPLAPQGGNIYESATTTLNTGYFAIITSRNITSGNGDFNSDAAWSSGAVPGSGETAIINDGDMMSLSGDVTIGDLIIGTGSELDLNGFTLTIDNGCISNLGNLDVSSPGSTVNYAQAGAQCVSGGTYNNLMLSGSGTKTMQRVVIITGDVTIESGVVFDVNSTNDIVIQGNWTNDGTFTPGTGRVSFNGTTDQTFGGTGSQSLYNITVNKGSGELDLTNDLEISNELNLTQGLIDLNSSNLTIPDGGSIINAAATSYVKAAGSGSLIKGLSDGSGALATVAFEVGDDEGYTPFTFTLNSGSGARSSAQLSMRVVDAVHPNMTSTFHLTQYWVLNQVGLTSPDYNLTMTYSGVDVNGFEVNLEPIKYNVNADVTSFPTFSVDRINNQLSWSNLTTFSEITGDGGDDVVTPVELLYFRADLLADSVALDWATASELNNDFFLIQKTQDWENYEDIGMVQGNGTTNELHEYRFVDHRPYEGISYYRLKQVDFDGEFAFSQLVVVSNEIEQEHPWSLNVYPNPSDLDEGFNIILDNLQPGALVEAKVISLDGKVAYQEIGFSDTSGTLQQEVKLPVNAPVGNYVLQLSFEGQVVFQKLFLK